MKNTKIKNNWFGRLLIVVLILAIFAAACLFCFLTIRQNLVSEALAKSNVDTEKAAIQISQQMTITQEIIDGASITIRGSDDIKSTLNTYKANNKGSIDVFYYIDFLGNRISSNNDLTDTAPDSLMNALRGITPSQKNYMDKYDKGGKNIVRFASPIFEEDGIASGFAICEKALDSFVQHRRDTNGKINNFQFVFHKDGEIITSMEGFFINSVSPTVPQLVKQLNILDSKFLDMQNNFSSKTAGYLDVKYQSDTMILSYAPIAANSDWFIMEVIPEFFYSTRAVAILQNSLIIFAASFVLVLILFFTIAIRNIKIKKLTNTQVFTDKVTDGATESKLRFVVATLAKKKKNKKLVLIAADISNFNVINEIYGFKEGNEILKMTHLAWENVVKDRGIPARGFDDKFFIFYEVKKSADEVLTKINEFLAELKNICNENKKEYNIAYNFGAYQLEKKDKNAEEIFEKAKSVLEDSKFSTKNALLYTPEDVAKKNESNKKIEEDMVSALRNNEFSVYLQPKFNLLKKVVSTDALVRWTTRTGDVIPAADFIPVFIKNGFIVNVDMYMYESVCRILRNWLDKGYSVFPISLNHSESLILRDDYITKLKNIAEKYGIPTSLIEIEVDESWIYSNVVAYERITRELKENGFVVSIDSFGSRYASLELFKDVSADILKLDKILLYEAEKNERGKLVFSTIVKLAKALNIKVIAQGVETQKQANLVASMGCDITQGYLHGKPMPLNAFEQYYKKVQA